jgi:Dyp-type peroxidase family
VTTLDLDDIQATVLRQRPEPYYGTHIMLRVDDARAGRLFLRRLTPHIASAANWWNAGDAWIAVAISYPGLVALGVPENSLHSFPGAYRTGMAGRAEKLLDYGLNDPKNWDLPFGKGQIHILLSAFSDTEEKWRRTIITARSQVEGHGGVSIVLIQDFGAQPGSLNPFGYKDGIGQPNIEDSGVEALPGQGLAIRAGEFILGYPAESGVPLAMPQPDVLGRNGTFVALRKYQSRVGAFNRFLRENSKSEEERELLAARLAGRWRSGAPLKLSPTKDDPALGQDPQRNNDFDYADDPEGKVVPLGCHMRRMNPRDSRMPVLTDVRTHRIIRRGTAYGAPYDPNALPEQDDDVQRGVYFLLISAKAMDTLEFLQSEWINDGNFMGLSNERDPLMGLQEDNATFTIPKDPVRQRIHGIQTFNVLRGGEYMFMPSLSALQWLADLKD